MKKFKSTTSILDDLPLDFWCEQYRFSKMCVEIGKEKRQHYADMALTTGDWMKANEAMRYVDFWEEKYYEAGTHLREKGLIA